MVSVCGGLIIAQHLQSVCHHFLVRKYTKQLENSFLQTFCKVAVCVESVLTGPVVVDGVLLPCGRPLQLVVLFRYLQGIRYQSISFRLCKEISHFEYFGLNTDGLDFDNIVSAAFTAAHQAAENILWYGNVRHFGDVTDMKSRPNEISPRRHDKNGVSGFYVAAGVDSAAVTRMQRAAVATINFRTYHLP